ncbi:MAG: Gfo/Idh/MocA family oxidoreductase, partial [Muribaculaceae bacterium]|nr:Gfo/Idh/MocA family oxidoreductase [Muribaculaceae bacterium]
MAEKIKVAIVGYGNIGRFSLEAAQAAEDFEVVGVVRRDPSKRDDIPAEIPVAASVAALLEEVKKIDVAILATPTRSVEEYAKEILALGINTVDSFDIHGQIPALRKTLDKAAKDGGAVSVMAAGWDPGSDSVVRTLLEA